MVYDLNSNPLNNNDWAFALTECFHITAFALSIGTIMLVDFRLLGLGLKHESARKLLKDTGLWTLAGLVIVITSGLVIFSSDPIHYLYNEAFRWKITALVVGIIYNYTIHRKVAMSNFSPGVGALTGLVSVLIWVSVLFGGLWIAFV